MDSYPPHLLRLPGSRPGSPARGMGGGPAQQPATAAPVTSDGSQEDLTPRLLAAPGMPGTYAPPLSPGERPRNLAELDRQVIVTSPEPWPEGAYILIGTTGRRAHWTGSAWKGNESPGYRSEETMGDTVTVTIGAPVRSETEQTP